MGGENKLNCAQKLDCSILSAFGLEKYNSQRLLVQKAVSKTRLFYWATLENEFEQFSSEKCVHYCDIGSKIQNMEAVGAYELKESVASRKIVLFTINLKVDRTIRFLPAVSDC